MKWQKVRPGHYEATDPQDSAWRIVQSGHNEWEIITPGIGPVLPAAVTLAEAKLSVAGEVEERLDPAVRARRQARRARRARIARRRCAD